MNANKSKMKIFARPLVYGKIKNAIEIQILDFDY